MLTRSSTASAPEPDATANAIVLGEHETTGPLPVGFEFERVGTRYDHFDLSTDGFVKFGSGSCQGDRDNRLPLGAGARSGLGGGRVTYEMRGNAPRRRLVVSFAGQGVLRVTLQLIVYERTGIIEVRDGPVKAWETRRSGSSTSPSRRDPARTPRERSADC